MLKRSAFVFVLLCIVFSWTASAVAAQSDQLESCFVYYQYGMVKVHAASDKPQYKNGENAKLIGTIVNTLKTPLRDAILFAHLVRVNSDPLSFARDGHFLIDRLTLLNDFHFLPQESKQIEIPLPILDSYPSGDFQLQFFIVSKEGFYYSGRPFLPQDMAGVSNFSIKNDASVDFYIDPENLIVNGQKHYFREQISEFPKGAVTFSIRAKSSQIHTQIPVSVKYYKFDDAFNENLVGSDTINLANSNTSASTVFEPPTPGAYVAVFSVENPQQSMLRYRFAATGDKAPDLKMADLSLTNYPANKTGRAYVCFHSPSDKLTSPTSVTLSLIDKDGNSIEEKTVTRNFDGSVMAISIPLAKMSGANDFSLRASFAQEGKEPYTTVEKYFGCTQFANSVENVEAVFDVSSSKLAIVAVNNCGAKVSGVGGIDAIRVFKDSALVKEAYNLKPVTQDFSLNELPPGIYTAQIRMGETVKDTNFTVKEKPLSLLWRLFLAVILIIVFILLALYLKRKRKNKKKHHD